MIMNLEDLRECSQYDKLVVNGDMHWHFLDSWLFTDWKDVDSFPGKASVAEGVIVTSNDESYAAQLVLLKHDDLKSCSATLLLKKDANNNDWDISVNVISIEKENI